MVKYKSSSLNGEPIELVRKLCLTGVPLLIDTSAESARAVLALCVHQRTQHAAHLPGCSATRFFKEILAPSVPSTPEPS
eukprot:6198983-Pleurochrysis_carterae.AAC.8